MISVNLEDNFGSEIDGSTGQHPGTDSPGAAAVADMGKENGFDGSSPFAPESYDAAALIILAMQAAGSSASADLQGKVMEVANAPGEKIYPGELAKALKILADGGDVERLARGELGLDARRDDLGERLVEPHLRSEGGQRAAEGRGDAAWRAWEAYAGARLVSKRRFRAAESCVR